MTISEVYKRSKLLVLIPKQNIGNYLEKIPSNALIVSAVVFFSVASFGIGYLAGNTAGRDREDLTIKSLPTMAVTPAFATDGQVVASRNGTQYYFPWCGAVRRIKGANQIWFSRASSARRAGYTPSAHCKGVQK